MKHFLIFSIAIVVALTSFCTDADALEPVSTRTATYIEYVEVVDSRKKLANLSQHGGPIHFALFTVTPVRDNPIIPIGGESFGFSDVFKQCTALIPVFDVKTPQMCNALNQYVSQHNTKRYVVASASSEALEKVGDCYGKWFIADSPDKQAVDTASSCGANTILLPAGANATDDMVSYASSKGITLAREYHYSLPDESSLPEASLNSPATNAPTAPATNAPTAPAPTPKPPIVLPFGLEKAIAPLAGVILTISVAVAVFFRKRRA